MAVIKLITKINRKTILFLALLWIFLFVSYYFISRKVTFPQSGLNATFYKGIDFDGPPFLKTLIEKIDIESLENIIKNYNKFQFSAIFEGFIYIPKSREYLFILSSDDGSTLQISNIDVIANWGDHPIISKKGSINLEEGLYPIKILYYQNKGEYGINLKWNYSSLVNRKVIIHSRFLYPAKFDVNSKSFKETFFYNNFSKIILSILLLLGTILALFIIIYLFSLNIISFEKEDQLVSKYLIFFIIIILITTYLFNIIRYNTKVVALCDTYGYMQMGSQIAKNGFLNTYIRDPLVSESYKNLLPAYKSDDICKEMKFLFSPHAHYVYDCERGSVYCDFPPGFPLILSPFIKLGGQDMAFWVNPILSLLFGILLFFTLRRFLGSLACIQMISFLWFSPLIFRYTVELWSDYPSLILIILSLILCIIDYGKFDNLLKFLSGGILGYSIMIRNPNILAIVAILFIFVMYVKEKKLLKLLLFSTAFIIFGILPFLVYTYHLFGAIFQKTYQESFHFSTSYVYRNLLNYYEYLKNSHNWIYWVFMLFGFYVSIKDKRLRSFLLPLIIVFLSFFAFHVFLEKYHDKYIIPGYFLFAFSYGIGVYYLELILLRIKNKMCKLAAYILIIIFVIFPIRNIKGFQKSFDNSYKDMHYSIKEATESNAIIMCDLISGTVRLYSNRMGYRFTWTSLSFLEIVIDLFHNKGFPIYFYLDCEEGKIRYKELQKIYSFKKVDEVGNLYKLISKK